MIQIHVCYRTQTAPSRPQTKDPRPVDNGLTNSEYYGRHLASFAANCLVSIEMVSVQRERSAVRGGPDAVCFRARR